MPTHPGGQSIPKSDHAGTYCVHTYVKIFTGSKIIHGKIFANAVKVTISSNTGQKISVINFLPMRTGTGGEIGENFLLAKINFIA